MDQELIKFKEMNSPVACSEQQFNSEVNDQNQAGTIGNYSTPIFITKLRASNSCLLHWENLQGLKMKWGTNKKILSHMVACFEHYDL